MTKKVFAVSRKLNVEEAQIEVTFKDSGEVYTVSPSDFPEGIIMHATLAGLFSKLAGAYNNTDGDKEEAFKGALAQLKEGTWNVARSGDGTGSAPMMAKVLAWSNEISVEGAKEAIASQGWTDTEYREACREPSYMALRAEYLADKKGVDEKVSLFDNLAGKTE